MTYVYLDWNVFDRIEKKDNLEGSEHDIHSKIEQLITENKIITPYSNAHINDLIRGHSNNPIYIPKHLETLKKLTNNLCIVQYWGNNQTTWHYREVEEFFNSSLEDLETTTRSFSDLMDWDVTNARETMITLLSSIPVPDNFKEIYKASPVFNLMFPRTKTEMNMLALCEDLFAFSQNAKKDYSLYKSLKSYINQGRAKLKQQQKMFKEIDKNLSGIPTHLNFDEALEKYAPKNKTSENPAYQRVTDTFYKLDLKGYKSDDKFSNLIDDSLHVFYGAHCDYFVTLDDKCHYKAKETFNKLGIVIQVLKPGEFVECITNQQNI